MGFSDDRDTNSEDIGEREYGIRLDKRNIMQVNVLDCIHRRKGMFECHGIVYRTTQAVEVWKTMMMPDV